MTFYLGRLALAIGVLLSSALLVIHAQPYNDRALHELFPENCAASCFMNIHLGITTDKEALHLLKNNAWVKSDSVQLLHLPPSSSKFDDLAHIQWDWDAKRAPSLAVNPQSADANINIRNHIVESIAFDTTIPAAVVYYNLGSPSTLVFAPIHNRDPWLIQWVYQYTAAQLNLQMQVRACPYLADLWLQPLHVLMNLHPDSQLTTITDTPHQLHLGTVLNARESLMCRL